MKGTKKQISTKSNQTIYQIETSDENEYTLDYNDNSSISNSSRSQSNDQSNDQSNTIHIKQDTFNMTLTQKIKHIFCDCDNNIISDIVKISKELICDDLPAFDKLMTGGGYVSSIDVIYYLSQIYRLHPNMLPYTISHILSIMKHNNSHITMSQLELDSLESRNYYSKEQNILDGLRIEEIEQDCTPTKCSLCGNHMLIRTEPPPTRRADEGTTVTYKCNRIRNHASGRVVEWAVKG